MHFFRCKWRALFPAAHIPRRHLPVQGPCRVGGRACCGRQLGTRAPLLVVPLPACVVLGESPRLLPCHQGRHVSCSHPLIGNEVLFIP